MKSSKIYEKKMKERLKILVTNDDGIDSPGIYALANAMKELGDVVVAAPDRQQSAVGHALTIARPLRKTSVRRNGDLFGYAIDGTPSDCVKIALSSLLDFTPDLVVSGINHGQNTAINILYSGTVAAATEGMLAGIPSIAVSLASHDLKMDCGAAAKYAKIIAKNLIESKLPPNFLLNVNIPAIAEKEILGIKIVKQSEAHWLDNYEKRNDPFGREYYWFAGEYRTMKEEVENDDEALEKGYVTVTPVHFELTKYDMLKKLKSFEELNYVSDYTD